MNQTIFDFVQSLFAFYWKEEIKSTLYKGFKIPIKTKQKFKRIEIQAKQLIWKISTVFRKQEIR